MVAPMVNPYDPSMSKEERRRTWVKWSTKKKLMYLLAKKFPILLPYFYRRSFLSENHGQIEKWLALSLGNKVRILQFRSLHGSYAKMLCKSWKPYTSNLVVRENGEL